MHVGIIYEDSDIAALNKPAGLVVHGDGRTQEETLVDWAIAHYPEMKGVGEPVELSDGKIVDRPGVVHRLDRETSGVIVLAKNQKAHAHLKQQFQDRTIEKTYNAFVYGVPKKQSGVINKPIGKSKSDFRLRSAEHGADGTLREAVTGYKVLQKTDKHSFLEIHPKTGRTHQIRVHMKVIGHPVVCDRLYAKGRPCELGFERLALHARSLSLTTQGDERLILEAPLPEDFERALEALEKSA